jgi:hypothetical protein
VRTIIIRTREIIAEMDQKHPEFKTNYFTKYMDARKSAGLDETIRTAQDNWIKFLVQDEPLPGIDMGAEPPCPLTCCLGTTTSTVGTTTGTSTTVNTPVSLATTVSTPSPSSSKDKKKSKKEVSKKPAGAKKASKK